MAERESISVMVWRITGAVHDTGTAIATAPLWTLRATARSKKSVARKSIWASERVITQNDMPLRGVTRTL